MIQPRLLCIGDSLTEGYNVDAHVRWTNLLEDQLNIRVVNEGISGDTTAGILSRFYVSMNQHQPSHVIIMGGTNDVAFDIHTNFILANIKSMTRQARHFGATYIVGIPPAIYQKNDDSGTNMLSAKSFKEKLDKFRSELLAFAVHDKAPYIDFNISLTVADFLDDGVHPNETGHKIMMSTAVEVFRKLV